jgi:hypothetical protein
MGDLNGSTWTQLHPDQIVWSSLSQKPHPRSAVLPCPWWQSTISTEIAGITSMHHHTLLKRNV